MAPSVPGDDDVGGYVDAGGTEPMGRGHLGSGELGWYQVVAAARKATSEVDCQLVLATKVVTKLRSPKYRTSISYSAIRDSSRPSRRTASSSN